MAHANVSNSVLTIISSFSNGLDVLKKLRRSRKPRTKQPKKKGSNDEDALRLSRSLRHGPDEIGREYQAGSMRCDNQQFAIGDATAQTSLAEILLKLNTGLVGIITSFLSRDEHNELELDYQSLTELSEQSRVQTISVLRRLYQRLASRRRPATVSLVHKIDEKTRAKKPSHRTSSKHTRKRHPTLARVLIENSSVPSQIAMVRSSEARKQRSTTHSRSSSEPPKPQSKSTSATSTQNLPLLPPPYFPSNPLPQQATPMFSKPPRHQYSTNSLMKPRLNPKQEPLATSAINDPSSSSSPDITTSKLTTTVSRSDLHKPRILRPNTLYSTDSVRTGSTKLGEIPMHRWTEPWDYKAAVIANMEALAGGWPVTDSKGMERPKKAGWKRWFGRKVGTI